MNERMMKRLLGLSHELRSRQLTLIVRAKTANFVPEQLSRQSVYQILS